MPKKSENQPRGSQDGKTTPKVKKVAKTGAQRSREYRARVNALENAVIAGSVTCVESDALQPASQHNVAADSIAMRPRSLLYEALSRQSSQDTHQNIPTVRKKSKTPKTSTERSRACRERRKALDRTNNRESIVDAAHSQHENDIIILEDQPQDIINIETATVRARQQPYNSEAQSTSGSLDTSGITGINHDSTQNIVNQMVRKVDQKLDDLEKYVPFMNYLLQIDKEKYKKFIDIKHWILARKRYPMNVLQKIEQSILTQYRNLFYDDEKVPKYIMNIFNRDDKVKCFRVNLCSDDEDNAGNSSDDDDVIIIPSSDNPKEISQPQSSITTQCNQEQPTPTLEHCQTENTICIDSDNENNNVEVKEYDLCHEEKLFKRREDFTTKIGEDIEAIKICDNEKSEALEQIEAQKDAVNTIEDPKSECITIPETNLESFDLKKLEEIYNGFTKKYGVNIEQLLKDVNLSTSPENVINNIVQNSGTTFTPQCGNLYVPPMDSPGQTETSQIQQNAYTMQPLSLPSQPFQLNLRDPRIIKLLERNKNVPLSSTTVCNARSTNNSKVPNCEPTTYGEYKRLKAEKEKKAEEAKKAEETAKIVLEKGAKAMMKEEEAKRTELAKRAELEKQSEEAKRETNVNSNEVRNNSTLVRANSVDAPNQSTEVSSSFSLTKKGIEIVEDSEIQSHNYSPLEPQIDLRSMILKAILPYGDKILDVLRKDTVAKLSTEEGAHQETKSLSLANQQILTDTRSDENVRTTVGNDIQIQSYQKLPANDQKVIEMHSEALNNQRKRKYPKSVPYKRIRTISSSSSTSSTLTASSTSSPPPPSTPLIYTPVVKLRRLSPETILKYTKAVKLSPGSKTINIHLVEDVSKTKKQNKDRFLEPKPAKLNIKHKNVDILMTNTNTTFCALCKSKPSDLTNHYRRVHKTESYVARLSRAALSSLETNIPFAQSLFKSTNLNTKKYLLKCAFCEDELKDKFINFYKHFSTHTGEYAFQCGICKLQKPFEFDIQSHKCHSKSCRNARIQLLYQYHPNVLVIYLYCCKICNFVQLNEANTFKHLRDHHDKRQDDYSLIRKYILAAVNDEEAYENSAETDKNFEFLKKEDDILVINEAMPEEGEVAEKNGNAIDTSLEMVELPTTSYIHNEDLDNAWIETINSSLIDSSRKTSPAKPAQESDKRCAPLSSMENLVTASSVCALEINIKTESQDLLSVEKENYDSKQPVLKSSRISYRQYSHGVSYYGLFKCMATDCLYSTDASSEILEHLSEHCRSEQPPEGYLECAYCQLNPEVCNTPEMLIEHIQKSHHRSQFQCSVCCYRASSASHVLMHARSSHPDQQELIYKCASDITFNNALPTNISELLKKHVEPLVCPFKDCLREFQNVVWMQNHLMSMHSLPINSEIIAAVEKYACIYCTKKLHDIKDVKNHLVASHPDQNPFVCQRILIAGKEEDLLENLIITYVSLPFVPFESIKAVNVKTGSGLNDKVMNAKETIEVNIAENFTETDGINEPQSETKPNLEQLVQTAEESIRHSLLKLTGSTGISPNLLYHCPHPTCGGFFSSYEMWFRHMRKRHCCIISVCPHCPNEKKKELPLTDFKEHFELHCCHLYGCYHCGETFPMQRVANDHIALAHADINPASVLIQIEKVPLYFNQPFTVLMKSSEQQKDRYCFLLELQEIVQNRCKYVEQLYYDSIKTQWTVPFTNSWLENFPSYKNSENIKRKCFYQNCTFSTFDNEIFYAHLKGSHRIGDRKFMCAKCDFRITSENWDPIIDHIKIHVLDIHVCCVCSYYHHDRRKILEHLNQEHLFRDVPIVTIIRSTECVKISISIVFAQLRKTFSTIKSCFFCPEGSDSSWKVYATHLKKVHLITLQYFCEICEESLKLTECDEHFNKNHPTAVLRIRCRFATNNQLSVDTIKPLKLQIAPCFDEPFLGQKLNIDTCKTIVKQEACDNESDSDIEIVNDEDIVIANDTKMSEAQQKPKVIRCVNLKNLQNQVPNVNCFQAQVLSQHQPMPTIQEQAISYPIPELISPTTSNALCSTAQNTALFSPRIALLSQNSNFTGSCNYKPVKILIRPNSANITMDMLGNPMNGNYNM
ncbi:uncharacterized protein LOC128864930 isoform X2 [Anastrepha ludens]|nr:uncharacterized protein LOC128864930 isoform X2 [Anastrepha ludens]XP_053960676.1 uncharacterized protein LOC128864930 isoform X2 [Anastrepha ludens]